MRQVQDRVGKYEEITEARRLFGIKETDSIKEIKRKINAQLKDWHPDTSGHEGELSKEQAIPLLKARKAIMKYLDCYLISFAKEEVEKYLSPHEFWISRFGMDPMWSDGKKD